MGGGRERGRGKGGDGVSSITNQMLWTAGIGVPFPWDSAPSRSPRLRYSHCVSNRFRKVRTFFVLHIQSWRRQICSDGPTERPRDAVRKTTRGVSHKEHACDTAHTHRRASRSHFAVRPGPYLTRAHAHVRHTALHVAGGVFLGCMLEHASSGGHTQHVRT
jgi:hypothetical protein